MGFWPTIAQELASAATRTAFALAVVTIVELLLPRGQSGLADRLRGLTFWIIWIPVTSFALSGFGLLWRYIGIEPLLTIPLTMSWAGGFAVVLAPLGGALVSDFFFYWLHRAQHAWFWRYHAVHHSIRDMNAVNSYHHISQSVFDILLFVIPTSLIVGNTGDIAPAMSAIILLYPFLIHSPTRFHLGRLRMIMADNRFHRIHHSLEPRHFDKNFGAFTTIWDRLFGTAYFPATNEWPDTGIAGVDEPGSLKEWITLPFRLERNSAQVPTGISPSSHSGTSASPSASTRRNSTISPRSG